MRPEALTLALKQRALELGFNLVGIVAALPSPRLAVYLRWIEAEYHGQMAYLSRPDRLARRRDLNLILPGTRFIVCVGMDYAGQRPPEHIAGDPGRGRISNYAWGADYHQVMTPRLQQLATWLRSHSGTETMTRVYVDTGAIQERDQGQQAGLGFIGKNTMLIGPRRGSWFFLGELLTNASLLADEPRQMPGCGSCQRCLEACPTAAFAQPYVLDARRCISYLTIELKGWIPRDLRPLMGNWLYGCDICQDVCPFNRFAPAAASPHFAAGTFDDAAPSLVDILTMDEVAFQKRFSQSPIKRIGRDRLLRNACVNAGNWGSPAASEPLRRLMADPEPMVRGHAAWALGRIFLGGDQTVLAHLRRACQWESDARVKHEIALAIAGKELMG